MPRTRLKEAKYISINEFLTDSSAELIGIDTGKEMGKKIAEIKEKQSQ